MSPDDIAGLARQYAADVTYREPRERATAFHAHELCRGCGTCVTVARMPGPGVGVVGERLYLAPTGRRSNACPGKVGPGGIRLSPQGFGPARNIIAFTGGDLACQPEFYARCAERVKALDAGLWVLLETNGYGLTPRNLDLLQSAGIDAFWLDIKAYDAEVHRRLTGAGNEWVLRCPEEVMERGFVLEVLSLYIPGWVETDQIGRIARLLARLDTKVPFTILAFFPQYHMRDVPPPEVTQMVSAYEAARAAGLEQVRLGNVGVFARTEQDYETLAALAPGAW